MKIKNRLAEIQVQYSTKIKKEKEGRVQITSSEDFFKAGLRDYNPRFFFDEKKDN
ncbi:MAG: hypothetical protein KDD02_21955 [Phaeodactylibacter sp.]|nr:hypothetical protein [Phaeodactylibacter sp.]MCB9301895.1 hypothetical protein [Lewinellaceae bacterium]